MKIDICTHICMHSFSFSYFNKRNMKQKISYFIKNNTTLNKR